MTVSEKHSAQLVTQLSKDSNTIYWGNNGNIKIIALAAIHELRHPLLSLGVCPLNQKRKWSELWTSFSKNRWDRAGPEQSKVYTLAVSSMLMATAKHCDHFYSVNSPLKGSSLELSHHTKASIQLPSQDHTRLNPPRDELLRWLCECSDRQQWLK